MKNQLGFNQMKTKLLLLLLILNQIAFSQKTSEEYLKLSENCSNSSDSIRKVAITYLTKAIELDTNCFDCYYNRALRLNKINPNDAISDFQKASVINPRCYNCYLELGDYHYMELQDLQIARQYYYQALNALECETENDYGMQEIIIGRIGNTFLQEHQEIDFEEAKQKSINVKIGIWDSLINVRPKTQYFLNRAVLKINHQIDYQGALSDLLIVYKNTSDVESSLIWNIAACYSEIGEPFQAIQFYNRAIDKRIKEYPNHSKSDQLDKLYMNRGNCKMSLNDYRGALDDFNKAISVYRGGALPSISDLYNCLATAEISLNDFQGAINSLNKAIELNKKNAFTFNNGHLEKFNNTLAMTYYLRGMAKINLKNKESACKDWSKSGELGQIEAYDRINEFCK